jgi:hypothetical protein
VAQLFGRVTYPWMYRRVEKDQVVFRLEFKAFANVHSKPYQRTSSTLAGMYAIFPFGGDVKSENLCTSNSQ